MATSKRRTNQRVQHTRQMLQRAFIEVVREKGFAATSIQDITVRADVNRGTFYLHFTDKYMLLDAFVREDFQRLLARSLLPTSCWNKETLQLLIETLLGHFERKYQHQRLMSRTGAPLLDVTPLIEQAIHEELAELLLTWLKRSGVTRWPVPMEIIARIVGWAIFGAVIQWSQEETTISLEQMAHDILLVITEGVTRLVPDASL